MSCEGLCRVVQFDWRIYQYDGYYGKPGDTGQEVDETVTDETLWTGENLDDYSFFVAPVGLLSFRDDWERGVDRIFPRAGRRLDCKSEDCLCELKDEPTVVEDWSRWRRYEIVVRHVFRIGANTPHRVITTRYLIKGLVEARQRVVQGICRNNPNETLVAPYAKKE